MSAKETSQKSARFGFPDRGVSMPMMDMMQMISQLQGKMVDCVLRQNIEMLEFLKNRIEKDRALFAELGKNKDPSTALQQWSDFLQDAMTDYLSTAETKPATWRRKTRPVAGHQAPWRVRSPDSWRVPWRIGPEGQFCKV